jgi:hypothetical protein
MGPPKYPCFNRYCQRFNDLFGRTLADKVIAPAEEKLKDRTFRSLPSSSSFRAISTTGRCLFSDRDQSWSWRQTIMLGQDTLPFRQQDWPNPTPPPSPGPTTTWNQTGMIGQDVLPSGSKTLAPSCSTSSARKSNYMASDCNAWPGCLAVPPVRLAVAPASCASTHRS